MIFAGKAPALILSITACRFVPEPDIKTVRRVGWSIVLFFDFVVDGEEGWRGSGGRGETSVAGLDSRCGVSGLGIWAFRRVVSLVNANVLGNCCSRLWNQIRS